MLDGVLFFPVTPFAADGTVDARVSLIKAGVRLRGLDELRRILAAGLAAVGA